MNNTFIQYERCTGRQSIGGYYGNGYLQSIQNQGYRDEKIRILKIYVILFVACINFRIPTVSMVTQKRIHIECVET